MNAPDLAEPLFQALMESAHDAVVVTDGDGLIRAVNAPAEQLFGYSGGELVGQSIEVLVPDQFRGAHHEHRRQYFAQPSKKIMGQGRQVTARRKDGQDIAVEIRLSPLQVAGQLMVMGLIRDVTAFKETELDLAARVAQQAAVLELSEKALAGLDPDQLFKEAATLVAQVLKVNYCRVLELLSNGERFHVRAAIGPSTDFKAAGPEDANIQSQAGFTLRSGQPVIVEDFHSERRFRISPILERLGIRSGMSVVITGKPSPFGVLCVNTIEKRAFTRDDARFLQAAANLLASVLDRKRSEFALRQGEASLANAQRIAHLGNWDWNIVANELRWSEEIYRIFGLSPQQFGATYEAFLNSVHPGDREFVKRSVNEALWEKRPYSIDHRIVLPDGAERAVHEQGEVSFDSAGRPVRMSGTVQDITQCKATSENLRDRVRQQAAVAQLSQHALADADLRALMDEAVALAADALRVEYSKVLELLPDGSALRLVAGVGWREGSVGAATVGAGLDSQAGYTLRAGQPVIVEDLRTETRFRGPPLLLEHGIISGMSVKIAGHGRPWGVFGVHTSRPRKFTQNDVNFLQTMANVLAEALRQKRIEDELRTLSIAVAQTADHVIITDVGGQIVYVNTAFEKASGYPRAEVIGQTPRVLKSGKHLNGFYAALWQTILAGNVFQAQFINRKKTGDFYNEEKTITPLKNSRGEITHFVSIGRDISERLKIEEHLRQLQKMESVGQLAGGLAHDFNNILATIGLSCQLLEREHVPDDERLATASQIANAVDRAATLTRRLLAFGRRQLMQPRLLDLSDLLDNLLKMLHPILGEDVALEIDGGKDLPVVQADAGMIEQVIMNLAVNARDAMPAGGHLRLTLKAVVLRSEDIERFTEARPGSFVCLTVADTGCGIPPEVLPRIFEPFFTTKEVGKGTGLGLAMVYGIVRQHEGWIQVESEVGKGTTFRVFLPTSSGRAETLPDEPPPESIHGGNEVILVVEDEDGVRGLVEQCLRRLGYEVLSAVSGATALELWEKEKDRIDLLFTDIVMPSGVSGLDLAWVLRQEKPALKVILTSGYAREFNGRESVVPEDMQFLPKPYSPRALAQAIRACLDRRSPGDCT